MGEFRMPSLGADMEAGTLIEWKVEPGDYVRRGDIIGEVETEKGDIDVEVFENGVVDKLLVQPGEKVPVGAVLATIREEGEAEGAEVADVPRTTVSDGGTAGPTTAKPMASQTGARVRSSPLARRIAEEKQIDLTLVQGTGPGGAIKRSDVERFEEQRLRTGPTPSERVAPQGAAPPLPSVTQAIPAEAVAAYAAGRAGPQQAADKMRKAIAAAMSRSNREIPHYFLETRIDVSRCLNWLEEENRRRSVRERILPVVPLLKAAARALEDVPQLNAYWIDDELQVMDAVHIGFTISLRRGGVVVPALHHVDSRTIDELMADLSDLIIRAREGRLRSSELTDATITVTSLGDLGVETVFGVIYPPQVALVGFGRITEQPWAENGMLGVRPVLVATLAGDHRATDGRTGARYLDAFAGHLQDPAKL